LNIYILIDLIAGRS